MPEPRDTAPRPEGYVPARNTDKRGGHIQPNSTPNMSGHVRGVGKGKVSKTPSPMRGATGLKPSKRGSHLERSAPSTDVDYIPTGNLDGDSRTKSNPLK